MKVLHAYLLGPPRISLDNETIPISRRKAIALFAYLAVSGRPLSRDSLATLLWPDYDSASARANLRRDLYHLKDALGDHLFEIDRVQVGLKPEAGLWLDVNEFQSRIAQAKSHDHSSQADTVSALCEQCHLALKEAAELYTSDFLEGFGLPDSAQFDEWQFFQSEELRRQFSEALQGLIQWHYHHGAYGSGIEYARRWVALDSLHEPAQRSLMELYALAGQQAAALRQYQECKRLLKTELGLEPEEETKSLYEAIKTKQLTSPDLLHDTIPRDSTGERKIEQHIHFCFADDGVKLAYATVGDGPPLVKAANWLSHLEYEWRSPVWRHWLEGLSQYHTLVRYDERGCGLSDWDVQNFSFEAFLKDLETVVDQAGLDRFPLLGISQGGPIAIAYAVRHPEKVSHLILYGAYARGKYHRNSTPEQQEEVETLIRLIRLGWGKENPAFRQVFSSLFMPEGKPEQHHWFNELQRITTSPENAARIVSGFGDINVANLAPMVSAPTLVLHAKDDARIPFDEGRLIASLIPGARFIPLESKNHILMETEPAWETFLEQVHGFLLAAYPYHDANSVDQLRYN